MTELTGKIDAREIVVAVALPVEKAKELLRVGNRAVMVLEQAGISTIIREELRNQLKALVDILTTAGVT